MNNQECKIRTEIINLNTNEPMFCPYSIKIIRCKGSCNTSNDRYAKICVPDQIKDTNVKVFDLMSRTNETSHIKWHKTCKCRCFNCHKSIRYFFLQNLSLLLLWVPWLERKFILLFKYIYFVRVKINSERDIFILG